MEYNEKYMKEALRQAKKAALIGETPIGAVIVKNGEIISRGYNKRETKKQSLAHAEISAIHKACRKLGGWRLWGCELYVTLEPCCMCAGAIIQARIDSVYFGASDYKAGCAGSVVNLFESGFCHRVEVSGGHMEDSSQRLIQEFFKELRAQKKENQKKAAEKM